MWSSFAYLCVWGRACSARSTAWSRNRCSWNTWAFSKRWACSSLTGEQHRMKMFCGLRCQHTCAAPFAHCGIILKGQQHVIKMFCGLRCQATCAAALAHGGIIVKCEQHGIEMFCRSKYPPSCAAASGHHRLAQAGQPSGQPTS